MAEDIGVRAGFAFPVLIGNEVAAVLEFFCKEAVQPDENILEIMAQVGSQFGRILERKRAEEALWKSEARFRVVVNNSPAKIHIKDLDGRYLLVNRQARRLFGVTNEQASGKTTHDLFPPEIAAAFTEHDRSVLETGQAVEQEEEWPGEEGIRTYLTVKFPIFDTVGRINGVRGIGTDITERSVREDLSKGL